MKQQTITKLSMVGCLLALGAQSTRANSITYTLSTPNTDLSAYAGPYGTVKVDLTDATHATITFTSDTVAGYTFLFGGAQMADVNLNASSFSLTVTTPGTTTGYSSQNVSMFGTFNAAIDNFDGNGKAVGSVMFDVADLSGSWGTASDVLIANGDGEFAAAHIFVRDPNGGNPLTGYAGTGRGSNVPDGGSTMALLGLGLLSLGWMSRMASRKSEV